MIKEVKSTASIKQQNVKSIKKVILEKGSVTKPEVAEKTGLSVVTCGTILNELTANGTIVEKQLMLSNGGRPAMSYQYNTDSGNILCAFVYTENNECFLRYQIIDILGNIKDVGVSLEKKFHVKTLTEHIKGICKKKLNVKVITLGLQGCINNGIVEYSDITELSGVNLAQIIQEETGITTLVENDMNTVTLGYSKKNSDEKNVAMLFFPKGQTPAGGFIVDGNILRGTSNLAGELSFFPFGFDKKTQQAAFSNVKKALPFVNQLVIATTVFMDPAVIVITGGLAGELSEREITSYLKKTLNRNQLPKIEIRHMVEAEYIAGLYNIGANYLVEA